MSPIEGDARSLPEAVRLEFISKHLTASGVPYGHCHCGCGMKTPIAPRTALERYRIAGEPIRYVRGHNARSQPHDYAEEDRGYKTACWIWQRHTGRGYGIAWDPSRKKSVRAHRLYYERHKGLIPHGHHIDHLCEVPLCVNPEHLEAKLPMDNVRRGTRTKLTMADAVAIRASQERNADLARRYDVRPEIISNIRLGRTFKQRVFFEWETFAAAPEKPSLAR
jgi:hypothetical protein